MMCRSRAGRFVSTTALLALLGLGSVVSGCRTTNEDVHRWANTAQGPRKLVAVMTHDKYPMKLRVESAMTLVGMKPRAGRRVGITQLLEALNEMPESERERIVQEMVPILVEEIKKPPTGKGEARVDTSIPYKDAAYAMLTNDGGSLVTDPKQVDTLENALAQWAVTDFAARMDDSSQKYGMEQLLRALGAKGVRGMPALIAPDAPKIDRIAGLVADLGDQETKLKTSKRLVDVAKQVDSDRWKKSKAPKVEAANKASKLEPTKEQFEKQLDQYQEEELLRVFSSMKKIGQPPVVEYLLDYASNEKNSDKRRAAALAALEGNLDKNDKKQIDRLLKLAEADSTPDAIRDVALRRIGEMPRDAIIDRLYKLFDNDNWKVRWVAAELVLKTSNQSHLPEFVKRLGRAKGLAITEPLRYGKLIGELKGKQSAEELADEYASRAYPVQVRLSALGYYYDAGNKTQLSKVQKYASDKTAVPECLPDATDCEWKCTVTAGKKQHVKEIETVGDFVEYCVEPAMEKRNKPEKKAEKEDEEKKD